MNNSKKYLFLIVMILFVLIGVSLAYFGITIIGNDTAKGNNVVTGNLELTFNDSNELIFNGAFPGDYITKTISVKNTGTKEVSYNLVWTKLTNEITNNELVIEATCKRLNSSNTEEGTCESISQTPIKSSTIKKNISIEPSVTHEYNITITFIDTGKPQNYNKNKTFEGKLGINESAIKTVYCTYDGKLTQGVEYINGQYTYRYMQEGKYASSGLAWQNITTDGWGVQLTDKTSTDPVTSELCTYINGKSIISMSNMFSNSKTETIDLSNVNTSNVTDMYRMFGESATTSIIGLENFNTSKVTKMDSMFFKSQVTTLNLNSFDTSNVTDMSFMFSGSQATTLNLSNFDTSKVANMTSMFSSSQATTINLSSFDTSKVTDMSYMFRYSQVTTLDLSNFDTSNVTSMSEMFLKSKALTIDLSNFNTSNVIQMSRMFSDSQVTSLDLSNFDTSNVMYMDGMFSYSKVVTLDLSNFDTSKVTYMTGMFSYSKVVTLDLSSFDTSNVIYIGGMFARMTNLKAIYVGDKFSVDNATTSDNMFYNCTKLVGGAGTKYNSSYVDKTYARIDGGTSSPGYFTAKSQ